VGGGGGRERGVEGACGREGGRGRVLFCGEGGEGEWVGVVDGVLCGGR